MSTIRDLEDRAAVTDVVLRYATALDTRDWDLLRTCFTDGVVTHYGPGPAQEGYEAFERTSRAWLPPQVRSQHLIANVVVEVDGDAAASSAYVRADHVHDDLPGEHLEFVGRYLDDLVRTATAGASPTAASRSGGPRAPARCWAGADRSGLGRDGQWSAR